MKRKFSILIFLLMAAAVAMAQNYTLTGEVEPVVHVGENFKLRYVVNTTDARNFTLGHVPDALDVLIGPSQSTSISRISINGSTKTTETLTLTYVLSANQTGKFTIPAASVKVGGQTIKSAPLTVQVIAGNEQQASRSSAASGNNFFVMAVPSKRHVAEYEPFLLTYKVCWHPDLPVINLDAINLELQNVYMQPYNDTQQKSKKVETINGRVLVTVDWQQYVIYPQKSGKLQIPSMKLMGYVREDLPYDPFDPFSAGYREVPKQLTTPVVDIQVDELADKPADFSGGVGRFSITGELDKAQVKENTPITISVKVSGRGNLNMLKEPILIFPRGFDTYDSKQTEDFKLTSEGLNGSVSYEFVAVPQRKGNFVLPPAKLTYYDLDSRTYKTVQTDSFRLEVLKGDGSSNAVRDYSSLDESGTGDIRGIKMGVPETYNSHTFFGSSFYFILMAALFIAFVVVFTVLRQRATVQADVVKAKGRRANKVAVRKLRKAAKLMHDNKPGEFYDETLRALWGYVGDKLNIPVAQLSHDNISQKLAERNVHQSIIDKFIGAIDECEFERYAPGDPKGNMNKVYDKAILAIEKIEEVMKRGGKKVSAIVLLLLLAPMAANAATKAEADSAYVNGNYQKAITEYESLLKQGSSAEIYYNLGNAYYRTENITRAVLNYERALLLSPGDSDIRFNLQIARSKTIDKIVPESEMFFVTWYRSLVNMMSVDGWGRTALISLALVIVLFLVYLFSTRVWMQKVGFFGGGVLLVLFVVSNFFAWQQRQNLLYRQGAIVVAPSVTVKSTPAQNGTDLFILHEGTKVIITDGSMKNWREVRLADGKKGWIESKKIEVI